MRRWLRGTYLWLSLLTGGCLIAFVRPIAPAEVRTGLERRVAWLFWRVLRLMLLRAAVARKTEEFRAAWWAADLALRDLDPAGGDPGSARVFCSFEMLSADHDDRVTLRHLGDPDLGPVLDVIGRSTTATCLCDQGACGCNAPRDRGEPCC